MIICAKALKTQFINYPVVRLSDASHSTVNKKISAVCLVAFALTSKVQPWPCPWPELISRLDSRTLRPVNWPFSL